MTMILFTGLNIAGVVFLLYVLVQFWREGHKTSHSVFPRRGLISRYRTGPEVMLLRYSPLPEAGARAVELIPFPTERTSRPSSQMRPQVLKERTYSAR